MTRSINNLQQWCRLQLHHLCTGSGSQSTPLQLLTALFEVGPVVLSTSTVRDNKQVKPTPGCSTHCTPQSVTAANSLPSSWLARPALEFTASSACAPPTELQAARLQRSVSCSAKPSTALGFKFRLHLRPHTPRSWCVEEGGGAAGSVWESGGAHHGARGWASCYCWYWAARRASGTIHQNRAVCTVGIVMNNPCFLYAPLC